MIKKIKTIKGYIYLIKIGDTIKRIIYKIGRSISFNKRINNYHYPEILFIIKSEDIVYDENNLIKIFKEKCKLDKGNEFFIANNDAYVIKLCLDYFANKKNAEPIAELIAKPIAELIAEPIAEPIAELIIKNNNICHNINCNKKFNYLSELKTHLIKSYNCSKDIKDIDLYILQKKNLKKSEDKKCIICNNIYSKKSSLDRHIKSSQCSVGIKELKIKNEIEEIKNEIIKIQKNQNYKTKIAKTKNLQKQKPKKSK